MNLVLGTAQLSRPYGVIQRTAPDPDRAQRLLTGAAALGVRALDTAPLYDGAEEAIGTSGWPFEVHTKIDPAMTPSASLARSLTRLRRERVDVLYVHRSSEVRNRNSPVIAEAHALVGDNVGRLGASVYEPDEFDAAVSDPRITVIQVPLNVLDRRIGADRLRRAADRDVVVYARSVLLQGVLTARPEELPAVIGQLRSYVEAVRALTFDRTVLDLAVGWVRSLPGVHAVVIGAESAEDLADLVAACRAAPLADHHLRALQELALPPDGACDPRRWTPER